MEYKEIKTGSSIGIIEQLQKLYDATFHDNILLIDNDDLKLHFELFQPFEGIEIMKHQVLYKKDMMINVPASSQKSNYIYIRFEFLGKANPTLLSASNDDFLKRKANIMSAISTQSPLNIVAKEGEESKWLSIRVTYDFFLSKMKYAHDYIDRIFSENSQWAVNEVAPLEVYNKLEEIFTIPEDSSFAINNSLIVGNAIICLGVLVDRVLKRENPLEENYKKVSLHEDDIDRMNLIRDELMNTLKKTPSLPYFVDKYGISVSKLKRDFNAVFGTTVHRFHTNYKLELAHIMLVQERKTVTEVARYFGYSSVSKFSSTFKTKFNISPKEISSRYQR